MSLVGSLEDLCFGDILQIIHLSRKSGVLQLRCQDREGQVVFHEGLIRRTLVKGGPGDLGELLTQRQILSPSELVGLLEEARAQDSSLGRAAISRGVLDAEQLDELRRAHAESAVVEMFEWSGGDFSFEVRQVEPDPADELFLNPGLNPQFLVLEGTRHLDELQRDEDAEILFSEGEPHEVREPEAEPTPLTPAANGGSAQVAIPQESSPVVPAASDVSPEPAQPLLERPPPAVVAIDPELPVLEWLKSVLAETYPRVHIFQHSEPAIVRIRQYLARADAPLVLVAEGAPAEPHSSAANCREHVRRLQARVPQMQVMTLIEETSDRLGSGTSPSGERLVPKPSLEDLKGLHSSAEGEGFARRLRAALDAGRHLNRRGALSESQSKG